MRPKRNFNCDFVSTATTRLKLHSRAQFAGAMAAAAEAEQPEKAKTTVAASGTNKSGTCAALIRLRSGKSFEIRR